MNTETQVTETTEGTGKWIMDILVMLLADQMGKEYEYRQMESQEEKTV